MPCAECFTGHINKSSESRGHIAILHGRPTYIAQPNESPIKGIIIIIPDGFGWEFVNNRLLADHYATMGNFKVYLPDFMDNSASPPWLIDTLAQVTKKNKTWADIFWQPYYIAQAASHVIPFLIRNRFGLSQPKIQAFFEAVRSSDEGRFGLGAAGFCWGGQHAVRLAHGISAPADKRLVDAVFTAHPSDLDVPGDFEKVRIPISLAIGDQDVFLAPAIMARVHDIWYQKKSEGLDSEIVTYPGAGHGFSIRADPFNKIQVEQSEEAEVQAVKWFQKYLPSESS